MCASESKKQRITLKFDDPNPLFTKWLTEWKETSIKKGTKLHHTFSLALTSLAKYPLPLETGMDCKILRGFGDKLCQMLDNRLKKHREENGELGPSSEGPPLQRKVPKNINKPPPEREYVPQNKSGAFAILVALYEKSLQVNYPGFVYKLELIKHAQPLTDVSFTEPEANSFRTAWSCMSTLLEKQLVIKKSCPAKFSLSEDGLKLARRLHVQHKISLFDQENEEKKETAIATSQSTTRSTASTSTKATLSRHASSTSTKSADSTFESVIFAPNTFEIILIVDTHEVGGIKGPSKEKPLLHHLEKSKVEYEIRDLKVGDYAWICKSNGSPCEMVLPYVVERKRMDDLGQSIKDGRFHEQKHRLKQCGMKNLIYLVESFGNNGHLGLPINSIYQGAANTLVQDGFIVKFTQDLYETSRYLSCLTNLLKRKFLNMTLVSCLKEDMPDFRFDDDLVSLMDFKQFNKASQKNKKFNVRDMFTKQLLQIRSMSFDKAQAITAKYPTPKLLRDEYESMDPSAGEALLAKLKCGNPPKNLGPVLSKTVYHFYCDDVFE